MRISLQKTKWDVSALICEGLSITTYLTKIAIHLHEFSASFFPNPKCPLYVKDAFAITL